MDYCIKHGRIRGPYKTGFHTIRKQLVLSNLTEELMIQNQIKSVDELWNFFKSEIHELQNEFVPK